MSVRGKIALANPDAAEVRLELTMTLGEWKKLAGQMKSSDHPSWRFRDLVSNLVLRASTHFTEAETEGEEGR
jgi:hypothetical protein